MRGTSSVSAALEPLYIVEWRPAAQLGYHLRRKASCGQTARLMVLENRHRAYLSEFRLSVASSAKTKLTIWTTAMACSAWDPSQAALPAASDTLWERDTSRRLQQRRTCSALRRLIRRAEEAALISHAGADRLITHVRQAFSAAAIIH